MNGGIFQIFRRGRFKLNSLTFNSPTFNILRLFDGGAQGAWYDPGDMSTLFQDAAGTIPVTAVEQPVGKMLDKSGRGNHATQATTTKRPTLKQDANGCYYLSFDGVDDAMQTGNINFTSTDKMTVWAGVTKLSDVSASVLLELSPNSSTYAGAIMLRAVDYPGAPEFTAYLRGSAAYAGCVAGAAASPATKVMTGLFNTSAPTGQQVTARLTGITGMQTTTNVGGGMLGNYSLYIGARAGTSLYFNGRLYSLIVRGAQSTLSQIEATELYIKQKMRLP